MVVIELILKDFGRHKYLKLPINASVVGILGKNGSGKSLILESIHWLLTGYLKDKADTYVRQADKNVEEPPTIGGAKMTFKVGESIGVLEKQLGESTARKLIWEGETWTKVGDIESILNQILGADKYAIDNAVFPAQGELDTILMGSQAQREELLIKLLLLGHMHKISESAISKAAKLGKDIGDFSALVDELQEQRSEAENALATLETELSKSYNPNNDIVDYSKFSGLEKHLETSSYKLRTTAQDIADIKNTLNRVLGEVGNKLGVQFHNPKEFLSFFNECKNDHNNALKERALLYQTKAKADVLRNYEDILSKIAQLEKEAPEKDVSYNDVYTQRSIVSGIRTKDDLIKKIDETIQSLSSCITTKKTLQEKIESLDSNIKELNQSANEIIKEIELCELVSKICGNHTTSTTCPVCTSSIEDKDLSDHIEDNNFKLNNLRERRDNRRRLVGVVEEERSKLLVKLVDLDALKIKYDSEHVKYHAQLSELPDVPLEVAQAIEQEVTIQYEKCELYKNNLNSLRFRLNEYGQEIDSWAKEQRKIATDFNPKQLFRSEETINNTEATLTKYNADIDTVGKLFENYKSKFLQHGELQEDINAKTQELADLSKSFSSNLKDLLIKKQADNTFDVLAQLNSALTIYQEKQGEIKQARLNADNLRNRQTQLDDRLLADKNKRIVVDQLKAIGSAFSRHGIPMAYVNYRFKKLVELTQDNLDILGANFSVQAAKDRPVAFEFFPVDSPGYIVLSQDKLSGGQRVRLCIAFLLAIQQLIIPDLGFLVLDEPSMHLDVEGKESLRDLLLELNQQLHKTDTQVFVCDHAEELESAFEKVIKL